MPTALTDPDPAARVEAIRALRYRDLKDPTVLEALLACCADTRPAAGAQASQTDPFAAFFGGAPAAAQGTVADEAVARLKRAGLPPTADALALLVARLEALEPGAAGPLPEAAVALLTDTRWPDAQAALRAVVPALQRLDVPLFPLIVQAHEASWDVLCTLATAPWVPRTFNELLNHPPLHDQVVQAVEAAAEQDALGINADGAVGLLATLLAWNEDAGPRLARQWQDRWPWTVVFAALDGDARGVGTWLDAGATDAPDSLAPRLAETLKHRGPVEDYPFASVLAWLGDDHGLLELWPVDDAVASVLLGWAKGILDDTRPLRGWSAIAALARCGRFDAVRLITEAALAQPALPVPWEADVLVALAEARAGGLPEALARGAAAAPDAIDEAVPALLVLGDGARPAVEAVLQAAEAAPEVEERSGRSTVTLRRAGVDIEALQPVIDGLDDAALSARHDAVMPVVRGV